MTLAELNAKVRKWDLKSAGDSVATSHYGRILDQLYYHAKKEWRVYIPAEHPDYNQNYLDRLAAWVGNVTDEAEQQLLLEYALYISFFSHDDFIAMYRTAMDREIMRWVAMQVSVRLENGNGALFHEKVHQQVYSHTWFCPVTDSMDINRFYKANLLQTGGHRPNFSSLQLMAEHPTEPNPQIARNWIQYMANPSEKKNQQHLPLLRLVLLEDIVGSADQCLKAVRWAVKALNVNVLFVPLILCPNGVEALKTLEQESCGRLTVRPVIELRRSDLLGPERHAQQGWPISEGLEDLALRLVRKFPADMRPFGFNNTGCSLATFSNTPDNTLPIVHYKPRAGGWEPLFPRVFRG